MNIIKKLLIYFLLFLAVFQFTVTSVNAESVSYGYTYNLSGASDDSYIYRSSVTDSQGNVYTAGYFYGSNVDLDPTTGTNLQNQTGVNASGFLTKINSDGTYGYSYVWHDAYFIALTVDLNDNIYGSMRFDQSNNDLDPTSGTDLRSSAGSRDIALIKINSSGAYQWALSFGGSIGDHPWSVKTDSNGNIYISGYFGGTNVDMDPTSGTNLKTASSATDGFITKINANATYGYTYTINGTSADIIYDSEVDSNNNLYYLSVSSSSSIDFDPTSGTDTFSTNGSSDTYLTKINSDGTYGYTYKWGGTGFDESVDILIDTNNDIFISGYFENSVDFNPTSGTDTISASDTGSGFLTKINSDGTYGFTRTFGGTSAAGTHMDFDSIGNIYVVGYFNGSNKDFDSTSGTSLKSSVGDYDVFISKFTSDGNYLFTYTWGGSGYEDAFGVTSYGNKVYIDSYKCSNSADFDPTSGTDTIITTNCQSMLTQLINDFLPPTITLSSTISNSSDTTPTITGTATDSDSLGTITSIEFQVDSTSGSWTACTADDGTFDEASEPFTCSVPTSLTEGNHTIYFRATDSNSNTTSTSFTSNGFKIDTTNPTTTTSVSSNGQTYEKRFQPLNIADLSSVGDNDHPQFCFSKAYDTENGSGISSYTVRVDGRDYLSGIPYTAPNVGGDVKQDGDNAVIKETSEYWYRYSNDNRVSENQEICVYGKGDTKKLYPGLHTWSVRTQDNAGNSTETSTQRFLVKTSSGSFSSSGAGWGDQTNSDYKPGFSQGEWFPVSILKVGNRTFVNELSTLNPTNFNSEEPFTIATANPTLYGIANSGSKIVLTIDKEYFDEGTQTRKKEQVTKQETTANESSEWGINLTKDIMTFNSSSVKDKPLYYATLTVEKDGKLAIIYDIPLSVTTGFASTQSIQGVTDTKQPKATISPVKKKAQVQKETTIVENKPKNSEPTPSFLSNLIHYFSE